jgi:Cu+-exporting ATPase
MKEKSVASGVTTVANFQISGMSCSCESKIIEKRLKALPGIASFEINPVSYKMRVTYDPGKTAVGDIEAAVAKAGMKAKVIEGKK